LLFVFFFNVPPPTRTYPLSLHDALPICRGHTGQRGRERRARGSPAARPAVRRDGAQRVRVVRRRRALAAAPSQSARVGGPIETRSEEHTSELQSRGHLVCRLLLEKKKKE